MSHPALRRFLRPPRKSSVVQAWPSGDLRNDKRELLYLLGIGNMSDRLFHKLFVLSQIAAGRFNHTNARAAAGEICAGRGAPFQ